MSDSPLITGVCLTDNCSSPRRNEIRAITPHYMCWYCTGETCAESFVDPNRQASANYCIGKYGDIVLNVHERDRAWTSGSAYNDNQAITIECANYMEDADGHVYGQLPDATWDSLVKLCADICQRNGKNRLVYLGWADYDSLGDMDMMLTKHHWFQSTDCPGPWLDGQFERLADEVNEILKPKPKRHIVEDLGKDAVYRMFNGYVHLWTKSRDEAQALSDIGWSDEGLGWRVETSGDKVRRLYNPYNGQHMLTASDTEAIELIGIGWKLESLEAMRSKGKVPVHRLFNTHTGEHFLTTSAKERDSLRRSGWIDEGTGLWAKA